MDAFTRQLEQHSILWIVLSAFLGGVIGAAIKFTFEDVLRPMLGWKRDARRVVNTFTVPLVRSAESLERQINIHVRNSDKRWYDTSEYYRLAILYAFGEYLAWARILERRFGFVAIERSRAGKRFNTRLNGLYGALSSFKYFRWHSDTDAVDRSAVPRRMLAAVGEVMITTNADGAEVTREFTSFCLAYVRDPQFARWFGDLDAFLGRAQPTDSLTWDRLIAAGANLRALISELDPEHRARQRGKVVNLDKLAHDEVRRALEREFPDLLPSSRPS